jgi:hypothetical protein
MTLSKKTRGLQARQYGQEWLIASLRVIFKPSATAGIVLHKTRRRTGTYYIREHWWGHGIVTNNDAGFRRELPRVRRAIRV